MLADPAWVDGAATYWLPEDDLDEVWWRHDHPGPQDGDGSLLVLEEHGDWLLIELPIHPNGTAGCIRVHDEVMARLARLPLGTPAVMRARPEVSDLSVGRGVVRVVGQ